MSTVKINSNHQNEPIEFDTAYIRLDGTLLKNNIIDLCLIKFIFQCINNKTKIILLSKYLYEGQSDFIQEHKLEPLFDECVRVSDDDSVVDYINQKKSIFIDDTLSNREEVHRIHNIPTYDSSSIELLIK